MFNKIIAVLFLFALLTQTFSNAVIYCSFLANQDYIANNLCENRTKPTSCCKGKCQLRKRLTKDTNEDKQSNQRKPVKESEVLSSKSFFSTLPKPFSVELLAVLNDNIKVSKPIDKVYTIFHPPCA